MKIKWVKKHTWWELRLYFSPKRKREYYLIGVVDRYACGDKEWKAWTFPSGEDKVVGSYPTIEAAKQAVLDWWGLEI